MILHSFPGPELHTCVQGHTHTCYTHAIAGDRWEAAGCETRLLSQTDHHIFLGFPTHIPSLSKPRSPSFPAHTIRITYSVKFYLTKFQNQKKLRDHLAHSPQYTDGDEQILKTLRPRSHIEVALGWSLGPGSSDLLLLSVLAWLALLCSSPPSHSDGWSHSFQPSPVMSH